MSRKSVVEFAGAVVGAAVEQAELAVLAEASGDAVDGVAVDLQGLGDERGGERPRSG